MNSHVRIHTRRQANDLTLCEQEPIHAPGAIQPHGALLAAWGDRLSVSHASENLAEYLGTSPEAVLGKPITAVIGDNALAALNPPGPSHGVAIGAGHLMTAPDGRLLHLHAHRTGRYICIDIEPARPSIAAIPPNTLLHSVLQTFTLATNPTHLCQLAVAGMKTLTGYDRVMAYRFHPDEHGEVIAEALEPGLDSFLGLHYPAGDIPPQVRRLLLRQRVNATADTSYTPVPLLTVPEAAALGPLDLTNSNLRSGSPIHMEYLRNMEVAAVLSMALIPGTDPNEPPLWGMLVCQHRTPLVADPEKRSTLTLVGHVVSLLIRSLAEAEAIAKQQGRQDMLQNLVNVLASERLSASAIAAVKAHLVNLPDAAGAAVRIGGSTVCVGRTPLPAAVDEAIDLLLAKLPAVPSALVDPESGRVANAYPDAIPDAGRARQAGPSKDILAFDDLGVRFPALTACKAAGSGALLLRLRTSPGDAVLWFRPEVSRTVTWGGNPDEKLTMDPATGRLAPRASFAAWQTMVRGQAVPWDRSDLLIVRALNEAVEAAVAERVKADLARLRYFDPLTGLANRSFLQDRIKAAESDRHALLFLDLDRFKAVNDTMGHAAGDKLLIEVAHRLRAATRPDHLPVRLGGDEFAVMCLGLDRDAVIDLGDQIRAAIEEPFVIADRPCHVSASIGIAIVDQSHGLDLIRAADLAMYAAKQAGGNRSVEFDPVLLDRAVMHFELEQDIRAALSAGNQFVLLYQPIFSLTNGRRRLAGFEALVRWKHPQLGWTSPNTFITLAEKSGLIQPLGDWVLTTALRQGGELRNRHPAANLIIHVNVSAAQIPRPGFCDSIAGALEAEGFPPAALCLEVTESILTEAGASAILADIRHLGVEIAIDDFGMGYSSLSYLRRLPVDVVKLDRSFLEDVENDPYGGSFVGAVIALAHAAGKPVVFEGVETQSQLDLVLSMKADAVQGFFFAPPLSANAAEDLVVQHRLLDERAAALAHGLITPAP